MKTEPNDTAFPTDKEVGLTKREYFAGLAMQALCIETGRFTSPQAMAKRCLDYADVLIKELNK